MVVLGDTVSMHTFSFFYKLPNDFPEWLHHFTFPPGKYTKNDTFSLHPYQHLVLSLPFYFSHSHKCAVIIQWTYVLYFSKGYWCGSSSHMLIFHVYILFSIMSLLVFCLFSNWIISFLTVEFWEFAVFPRYESFVRYVVLGFIFKVQKMITHFTL